MEQRTDEWHQHRLGKVTASRVADVVTKTKTGWGFKRKEYAAQLICERLTGLRTEVFVNPAMRWGTETEPMARAAYSLHAGVDVAELAFVDHPTLSWAGCSPDGLIGVTGLVEIKCPNTATHLDTLEAGKFPGDYFAQIQFQLACTEREWCDAVSFDPRLPEPMQLFIERIQRDAAYIAELEAMVREFLAEIEDRVGHLRRTYDQRAAA